MMAIEEAIKLYFDLGLSYDDILFSLAHNEKIIISKSTLKRTLKRKNLYRRKYKTDLLDVAMFIEEQMEKSGQLHGYKLMHLKCIHNGYVVTQETVRLLLHIFDPEGIAARTRRRLRRRTYVNSGPDYVWHIDGYDKLKPYGICIHGAIDGFSRNIIWLEAYTTNNNPAVVASYFVKALAERLGCPRRIRADFGTENGHIEAMQKALRANHNDELSTQSFIYGSSNHNQRIESWWGFLRTHNAQFWMDAFHALKEADFFSGDFLDKNLIQFCFLNIIQEELDTVVLLWNTHRIRPVKNTASPSPSGKPVMIYNLPQLFGSEKQLLRVPEDHLNVCAEECEPKRLYPCDETVFELCLAIMFENNMSAPTDADDAISMYKFLRHRIKTDIAYF